MGNIAEIGFAADTSQLDQAKTSLTGLVPAAAATETQANKTSAALNKVTAAANGLSVATDNSTKILNAANGSYTTLNDNVDKVTKSTTGATKSHVELAATGQKSDTVIRAIEASAKRAGVSFDVMSKRVDNASNSSKVHTAVLGNNSKAANDNQKELGKIAEIAAVLEAKMLHLASNMGIFGEILTIIGPIGLAIAAGIGLAIVAIDQLVGSANRMGVFALQLQNLSVLSGMTATNLQSLLSVGVGLGLSTEENGQYLIRFTEQLEQVRNGAGALFDQLLKVDPALAAQLSVTKDSTVALNLLSQAYVKAGSSKNALANAASGGRGGAKFGLLLDNIAQKGGVDGVTASVNKLDQITKDQVTNWAKLSVEIDDASLSARNNIASIFTTQVLEWEKSFYETLLAISRVAKDFSLSSDFNKYIDYIKSGAKIGAQVGFSAAGPVGAAVGAGMGATAGALFGSAVEKFGQWVGLLPSEISKMVSPSNDYKTFQNGAKTTLSATGNPLNANGDDISSPGFKASEAQALVSALGSAATAQQKLDAQTKTLALDLDRGKIKQETYNQAVAGYKLDAVISQNSLYISSLGELATTQDLVKQKSLSLAKANQQGAGLTKDQIAAVKNITAAQAEQNKVQAQAASGVFDMAAAQKAANDTLQSWIDKGLVNKDNSEQMAAAQLVLARNIKATSDAAAVAAAPLQQLKQLQLDGSNFAKQLDTTVTGALNNMVSPIQDVMNGVTSLGQGFKNVGLVVVKAIQEMIIKMLFITPIAKALMSVLNPFAGLFGGAAAGGASSLGGNAASAAGDAAKTFASLSAKGNVFGANDNKVSMFAKGGAFTNRIFNKITYFANGGGLGAMGEAGPEAVMPLKRGSNGSLGVQMYGTKSGNNGMSLQITHAPSYVLAPGVTPQELDMVKRKQAEDDQSFNQRVGQAIPEIRRRGGKI